MSSSLVTEAESLIAAALRGPTAPPWPPGATDELPAEAARAAQIHGVSALVHHRSAEANWPAGMKEALHAQTLLQTMWEISHQRALTHLLAALHDAGATPVLIKGTALAYSIYPNPAWRSRSDTDMLIAARHREQVHATLVALGWERLTEVSGELISYQAGYVLRTGEGAEHALDLHWKINNSELLSRLFTHEELLDSAIPLDQLGPHARGTTAVHALLIACMHRCAHKQSPYYVDGVAHYEADRLIWLYDIHLLSRALLPAQWAHFASLALRKGLAAVCLEAMQETQSRFGSAFPWDVIDSLGRARGEVPARYLAAGKLERRWINFTTLRAPAQQARLVAQLLFPPREYMRAKYAQSRWRWLPWLYLRRTIAGLRKALRHDTAA